MAIMMARDARQHPLGLLGRCSSIAGAFICAVLDYESEETLLAALRGRFALTFVTLHVTGPKTWIADNFDSKAELRDAILASGHLPLFSSLGFPTIRGAWAIDGGFTTAGRCPLLPCRRAVYAISCGCASELPAGVQVDIEPSPPAPLFEMLRTPAHDEAVQARCRLTFTLGRVAAAHWAVGGDRCTPHYSPIPSYIPSRSPRPSHQLIVHPAAAGNEGRGGAPYDRLLPWREVACGAAGIVRRVAGAP